MLNKQSSAVEFVQVNITMEGLTCYDILHYTSQTKRSLSSTTFCVSYKSVPHKPVVCWEIQVEHGSLVEKKGDMSVFRSCGISSLLITKESTPHPK